ncbi:MAG: O-antigen ligase family protein [Patescibacteria group bacterium]
MPIYVSGSMLFPFITGKNFIFRILVEFIFALWLGLAITRPAYRPSLSPLVKAVTIFIAIVFLADLLGPNPFRSFFSNYERMEGFMMLFHLYLYFLMLISVFKTKKDWTIFFHSILIGGLIVSYVALRQKLGYAISIQGGPRVDGTIGNPTYLAAYLLFHVWLLAILIYKFWEKIWLRIAYSLIFLFQLIIIYFTATRGVVIALLLNSTLILAVAFIYWNRIFIFSKERRRRRCLIGIILLLAVIIPAVFWGLRHTDFVQNNETLQRLTNYSLDAGTIKSRFMIWNMAWRGFLERPILGWGQENFYLVFQKYYNPGMFSYEQWFDRSHNIIFDWLIHAGSLGLTSYLLVLGTAGWMIVKKIKKDIKFFWSGLFLIGLFLSYFIQDLFVFDNLNTYLMLFGFLAYTESFFGGSTFHESKNSTSMAGNPRNLRVYSAIFLVTFLLILYPLHIKPIKEARTLIDILRFRQSPEFTVGGLIGAYQQALNYGSFGDTEVKEQLGMMANGLAYDDHLIPEDRKKLLEYAIGEIKELTVKAPDVKHVLFLSSLLNNVKRFDPKYIPEVEKTLQFALKLSPNKQPVYFELAQFYLDVGQADRAIIVLQKAWDLDRSFSHPAANLWAIAVFAKKPEIVQEIRSRFNMKDIGADNLRRVALSYQKVEDFMGAQEAYQALVYINPKIASYHAVLAALYARNGYKKESEAEVKEAVRLDPTYQKEADLFLKMLKQGTLPK